MADEVSAAAPLERIELAGEAQKTVEGWVGGARIFQVMKVLQKRRWFSFLAEPRDVDDVREFSGLPEDRFASVLAVLEAHGVVEKEGQRVRLSAAFDAFAADDAITRLDEMLDFSEATVELAGAAVVAPGPVPLSESQTMAFARFSGGRSTNLTRADYEQAFLPHLPELAESIRAGRWLDIGCGVASISLTLAGIFPELRGTAIELVPTIAAEAKRRAEALGVADRVDVRCMDAQEFDEAEEYSTAFWAQPFFPEPTRPGTLAAILRALHPGGLLLMQEIYPQPSPAALSRFTLARMIAQVRGMPPYRTAEALATEAETAGFTLIRIAPTDDGRYVLTQRPPAA